MSSGLDGTDKSWDRPWTTEEMREKRAEWSLAGDTGLFKHLQQFSDNVMLKANKTREALDTLAAQLEETVICIDNVTNTSLALANTQFIESRVYEDDIEVEKLREPEEQEVKSKEQISAELIAKAGERVRHDLKIMDEKYERLEFVASDSEDEGDPTVSSVILRAKDPYQDRPLPYVIGSEKWNASSKVGLETSSSESEPPEEEEGQSDSDSEQKRPVSIPVPHDRRSSANRFSSSSSSDSDDYETENVDARCARNDEKLHAETQDNLDSDLEGAPVSRNPSKSTVPSFAEELAKRLGNVLPAQKPIKNVENTEGASINRSKDDIFTPDIDENAFDVKSKDLFSEDGGLFDDDFASMKWGSQPSSRPKASIIPPSIDIPPPMSSVSVKPKSAIDDLFGDPESEEPDDIFQSNNTTKELSKDIFTGDSQSLNREVRAKETLNRRSVDNYATNIKTSTPEVNDGVKDLFFGEGADDGDDLFLTVDKQNKTGKKEPVEGGSISTSQSENVNTGKKKPTGGVSVMFGTKTSDSENKRSSALWPTLVDDDAAESQESVRSNKTNVGDAVGSGIQSESSLAVSGGADNIVGNVETSGSSGISMQPRSIDNTMGSSMSTVDFQPEMTSTRLKSEEIYRERMASDSLFTSQAHRPGANSANNGSDQHQERAEGTPDRQDDVFYNDLFGPPPLLKNDTKFKSKVNSLFDDSDTDDELFSNTSSGSRSQKSADLLVPPSLAPQASEKSKLSQKRGLFDDDVGLFGSKESPDEDIFGISSRATKEEKSSKVPSGLFADKKAADIPSEKDRVEEKSETIANAPPVKVPSKSPSLFDDIEDEDDLFGSKLGTGIFSKGLGKSQLKAFDVNTDDLFTTIKPSKDAEKSQEPKATNAPKDPEIVILNAEITGSKEPLKIEPLLEVDPTKSKVEVSSSKKKEESRTIVRRVEEKENLESSTQIRENLFGDDDDEDNDDLFSQKPTISQKPAISSKPVISPKPVTERVPPGNNDVVSGKDKVILGYGKNENARVLEKTAKNDKNAKETKAETAEATVSARSSESHDGDDWRGKASQLSETKLTKSFENDFPDDALGIASMREPPKTLNIHAVNEEQAPAPKLVVSGKIKDLMGKMSDLKLMSPTDAPPVLRRNQETTEEEDRDSDDGGCISVQTVRSSPTISEDNSSRTARSDLVSTGKEDTETAVSFDEPVQVETLASTASKTRARIQVKRRPQSRSARQLALRNSGIDFDIVDASSGDTKANCHHDSNASQGEPNNETSSGSASRAVDLNASVATLPVEGCTDNTIRATLSNVTLAVEDRSELSFGKESSLSTNKNTLLSPSTDEEDLFDVLPELPKDPQKEDSLFDRAPILSPVSDIVETKADRSTRQGKDILAENFERDVSSSAKPPEEHPKLDQEIGTKIFPKEPVSCVEDQSASNSEWLDDQQSSTAKEGGAKSNKDDSDRATAKADHVDPLRDSSHDPLKDPSQLFAFVTKTPSPEKGKTLLFHEDDSLFSSTSKSSEAMNSSSASKKQTLDLFDDDDGDLFSEPLTKQVKKPPKSTKIDLFTDNNDDDGEENDLFGISSKKTSAPREVEPSKMDTIPAIKASKASDSSKGSGLFDGDDDTELFSGNSTKAEVGSAKNRSTEVKKDQVSASTSKSVKTSNLQEIFGDQSSEEDNIFTTKKTISKKLVPSTNSPFLYDDEDDDIFGKPTASTKVKAKNVDSRATVKKATITRDLRKTAEEIVEDPLSMLQKD